MSYSVKSWGNRVLWYFEFWGNRDFRHLRFWGIIFFFVFLHLKMIANQYGKESF